MKVRSIFLAAIFFILLNSTSAVAHNLPQSFLKIEIGPSGLTATLTAHSAEVADALHSVVSDHLENQKIPLQHLLEEQLTFTTEGQKLSFIIEKIQSDPETQSLIITLHSPWEKIPGEITIDSHLFPYNPNHETLVSVTEVSGRFVYQEVLTQAHPAFDYYTGSRQGAMAVLKKFIPAGMHHIFIGPDHILFILALLLAGGRWKKLVMVVTAFTIAHSITLALATLGIVQIPSRIIEPLIAFTVVAAGLRNLFVAQQSHDGRTALAFGFGLIHGFGFASVLQEFGLPQQVLGWSLLGFNVGVEMGQLCIVLAVVPLLAILRTKNLLLSQRLIRYGSIAIIITGSFWLIQRIFIVSS